VSDKNFDILIVDDDPDLLRVIELALNQTGHHLRFAEDGKEALERVQEKMPDVILLDMRMPVMSGWEFAREFRNHHGRAAPIVVMTAAEDSEIRAKEIGADAYLGKPFDLSHLHEVIEDALVR
jgi:CheY-like chemotaxis protein